MTVKDLKTILSGFDENLEVALANYSDDTDEELKLHTPDGVEQLTTEDKREVVVIYQENEP